VLDTGALKAKRKEGHDGPYERELFLRSSIKSQGLIVRRSERIKDGLNHRLLVKKGDNQEGSKQSGMG